MRKLIRSLEALDDQARLSKEEREAEYIRLCEEYLQSANRRAAVREEETGVPSPRSMWTPEAEDR